MIKLRALFFRLKKYFKNVEDVEKNNFSSCISDCKVIELDNGLGDYYQDLVNKYAGHGLESVEDQELFISELNKLLNSDIEFSNKMSILNLLSCGIEGHDIWRLIRVIR